MHAIRTRTATKQRERVSVLLFVVLFIVHCAAHRTNDRVREPLPREANERIDAAVNAEVGAEVVDAEVLPDGSLPDRDHDRVPDARDACPDVPELYNGYQDEDGCQDDPPRIAAFEADQVPRIQLLVFAFPANAYALRGRNVRVLEAMALAMRATPHLTRLAVIGRATTDERSPNALSERRARAVAEALQARGIDAARLEVRGVGATPPYLPVSQSTPRRLQRIVHVLVLTEGDRVWNRWTGSRYESVQE